MEVEVQAGVELTPEQRAAQILEAADKWQAAKDTAKAWKDYEGQGRAYLAALAFPLPKKGTQRYALPDGRKIKLVFKWNYTLGNKDMPHPLDPQEKYPVERQVEDLQEAINQLGNEGPLLAERLIKWKPELNETEYEKLNPELDIEAKVKALVDAILTKKPASPTLDIEPAKEP